LILLVPLGPDTERPRLPRVTSALIALNVLVFLFTSRADTAAVEREEASLERVAGWTLEKAGREHPALAERRALHPSALAFLLRDTLWPDDVPAAEDRERLERCRDDYRRLREGHPFYRFGFVPADPASPRLLTHLFLHADLLHLLFNMVFLWAVGGLLELSWGEGFFAAFYLASGVAAALTHAAVNAGSVEPAIGASGAVAGLMGAFAAAHGRQPMRLALVAMLSFSPRISFFTWPAWVFLGLWLLEQVFYATLTAHMNVGIAFGAHLGGFAFGALAGAVIARAVRGHARSV
jgi:membrane associated rhomboid family serine protease